MGFQTHGVVDANKELCDLKRQRARTAVGAVGFQVAGLVVELLSGEEAALERHNLLLLRRGRRGAALGVGEGRIDRLAREAGLTSIPHDRRQEPEAG